jgi:hypothetical protein
MPAGAAWRAACWRHRGRRCATPRAARLPTCWPGWAPASDRRVRGGPRRAAGLRRRPAAASAGAGFVPRVPLHPRADGSARWLADLPALARRRLAGWACASVHGGRWCTVEDASRFFSFRRDPAHGRMAAASPCAAVEGAEALRFGPSRGPPRVRCAQHVHHDRERQHAVQQQGEDRAQHGALAWTRTASQMYLLNARTLMAADGRPPLNAGRWPRDQGAHPLRGAAVGRRRAPSNFLALNPEAQRKALTPRARASPRACSSCCKTCSRAMCRRPTRACSRWAATWPPPKARGVRERAVPADRVQAADRQGARAADAVRAAVHQQVLHPRPAARQLADPLHGGQGHTGVRGQLAQPRRVLAAKTWDDYIEQGAIRAIRTWCRRSAAPTDQHAGLLRRRHHPGHRAGGAGRARRAAGRQR